MKFRLTALFLGLGALVAGFLVFSPANANVSHNTYITTKYVTMSNYSSTGVVGTVSVSCHGSERCRGKLYFEGSQNRARSYSLKGNSKASIDVTMNKSSESNPIAFGSSQGYPGNTYKVVPGVRLFVNEDAPKDVTVHYTLQTETRANGRIYYDISGSSAGLAEMHIELQQLLKGNNTKLISTRNILNSGDRSGYFSAKLGNNNTAGTEYRLRLTAKDNNGRFRSWWWRGQNGNNAGGSRYIKGSNPVYSTKDGFIADASFGTISGSAPSGAVVKVMAPPTSFSGGSAVLKELDVPSCADVYGQDTASGGSFSIPFLPYDPDSTDQRFLVNARSDGSGTWFGNNSTAYGSCYSLTDYDFSRANLIALTTSYPNASVNATVPIVTHTVNAQASYSGFSPTYFDEWIRVREQIPGQSVLDTPVVAEGASGNDHKKAFALPVGHYWVEVSRRTGCSTWYPSRFPNNSAYFQGADRGAEAWKSFKTLYDVPGSATSGLRRLAVVHGATYAEQGHKPSGYAGWMYRDQCKVYGAGTINSLTVKSDWVDGAVKTLSTGKKGAVVKGHVSRSGGRTNKEMMVRLSSSGGTLVLRTDVTDGSGNFYIAGVASGTYTVSVNSDSWRGIGRSFGGKHTITVKAGHGYNLGTLHFQS